jgi:hypothetical protein
MTPSHRTQPTAVRGDASRHGYDPWQDLRENWPEIQLGIEALPGNLLGELSYPRIVLRAGTSAAQRRCTLAHEIVHLERGVRDCGPWAAREELYVHDAAARRLLPVAALADAICVLGSSQDVPALAELLDVDGETLRLRLHRLGRTERRVVQSRLDGASWLQAG